MRMVFIIKEEGSEIPRFITIKGAALEVRRPYPTLTGRNRAFSDMLNLVYLVFDIATGCLDDDHIALFLTHQGPGNG
jgi:hypothetical protein